MRHHHGYSADQDPPPPPTTGEDSRAGEAFIVELRLESPRTVIGDIAIAAIAALAALGAITLTGAVLLGLMGLATSWGWW